MVPVQVLMTSPFEESDSYRELRLRRSALLDIMKPILTRNELRHMQFAHIYNSNRDSELSHIGPR